jgi:hypothetical protein
MCARTSLVLNIPMSSSGRLPPIKPAFRAILVASPERMLMSAGPSVVRSAP